MVHPEQSAEEIDINAYTKAFQHRPYDWQKIKAELSSDRERYEFMAEIVQEYEPVDKTHSNL